MTHPVTWIVLADGSRARVLERRKGHLGEIECFSDKEAQLETHLIVSDRNGRVHESASSSRHAIEAHTDPHQEKMAEFVHVLALHLNEAAAAARFDKLILFAAPRTLGLIRKSLQPAVTTKIQAELPKDLTKIPLDEIPQHLGDLPAI